jgi:hypothetical protein
MKSAFNRVIAGLDPAIHEAVQRNGMLTVPLFVRDARAKPAHDGSGKCRP